jgi:gamma-glutamyl phosphate reductase
MNRQTNARLFCRDKTKARGPMGLEELTSYKWLGLGTGQIRA